MGTKQFSERLTNALRGDISSIVGIGLFLALWVVFYYVVDFVIGSLNIISLIVSFYLARFLIEKIGQLAQ